MPLKKLLFSFILLVPLSVNAQVFNQSQMVNPPYLNGGIPYATSSAGNAKYSPISTTTLYGLLNIPTNTFGTSSARASISSSATGLSYDNTTGIFTLTSGFNIPLTASTTNWNSFFNTPSTRITAGSNCSWVVNTFNCTSITATTSINGAFGPTFLLNSTNGAFTYSTSSGTVTLNVATTTLFAQLNAPSYTYGSTTYATGTNLFGGSLAGNIFNLNIGNVGIGTSTPIDKLSVIGSQFLSGAFKDSTAATGTLGKVLLTTGTSTLWVSTSSLGISGNTSSFSTTSILGLATTSFSFITGISGTDFNIATTTTAVIFNIPDASASARGLLTSANFTIFNNKLSQNFNVASGTGLTVGNLFATSSILFTGGFTFGNATGSNLFVTTASTTNLNFTNASSTGGITTGSLFATNGRFTTSSSTNSTTTNFNLSGWFRDSLNATGTSGQYLLSTGTSTKWTSVSAGVGCSSVGSAGTVQFASSTAGACDGSSTLFVVDTVNGRIGIGTSSPYDRLSVAGNIVATGTIAAGDTAPVPLAYFSANKVGTIPSGTVGTQITFRRTDSGGGTNTGYRADLYVATSTTVFNLIPFNMNLGTASSGAILSNGSGFQTNIVNVLGATFGNAVGANIGMVNQGSSTLWEGINVSINNNTGTLPNTHGITVGDITSGVQTNNAIAFNSTDPNAWNYFAGNTGVGTSTPSQKLAVVGNIGLSGAFLDSVNATGTLGQALLSTGTSTLWSQIPSFAYGSTTYATGTNFWGGTLAGNIFNLNLGSIGIGTTTPRAQVHINSASTTNTTLAVQATPSQTGAIFDVWSGGGTSFMNVQPSGLIGLGTTTPFDKLDIIGSQFLSGAFKDSTGATGTLNQVLVSTGTSTQWVATSSIIGLSGSVYTGVYPISVVGTVISTFFSTSTANSYALQQTFVNASATAFTSGQLFFTNATGTVLSSNLFPTGLTSSFLAVDSSGKIVATTTPALVAANNIFTGNNTFSGTTTIATTTVNGSTTIFGQTYLTTASTTAISGTGLTFTNGWFNTLSGLSSSFVNSTTTNLNLSGWHRDSINATGTAGQVLTSTGTSTLWATISSGITNAYASTTFAGLFTANTFNATNTFATTTVASSTVNFFNSPNALFTNATSTNFFASVFNFTNASGTNATTTNFRLWGGFRDSINATGTSGTMLMSNGTSTQWVATSTLGLTIPRIQTVTSAATVTPDWSQYDSDVITAQAANLVIATSSGSCGNTQKAIIRIRDNGTARALTFGSIYRAVGVTLPTTTVLNKVLYLGLMCNTNESTIDVVAVAQQ